MPPSASDTLCPARRRTGTGRGLAHIGGGSTIPRVALDENHAAFAAAAPRRDRLRDRRFDWLGEQGHIGLERVAQARRDPALVAPVKAAIALLGAIYARLRGDRRCSPPLARTSSCRWTRARADRHGDRARRAGALHLVRLAALDLYPRRRAGGLRRRRARAALPRLGAASDGLFRGLPAKGFGFGGVQRQRAYQDALRDLATPAMGHPPLVRIAAVDGDGAAAYGRAPRPRWPRLSAAEPRVRRRGHVDRRAAPQRTRTFGSCSGVHRARPARCRTARRRSRRGRCRGTRAGRGPPGGPCRRPSAPRPARISRIDDSSPCRSELAELAGEVGDQRVEHAGHDALAHRRGLAGDLRVGVDRRRRRRAAGTSPSRWRGPGRRPRAT